MTSLLSSIADTTTLGSRRRKHRLINPLRLSQARAIYPPRCLLLCRIDLLIECCWSASPSSCLSCLSVTSLLDLVVLNATIMRRARRNPAEYFKTSHSRLKLALSPEQSSVRRLTIPLSLSPPPLPISLPQTLIKHRKKFTAILLRKLKQRGHPLLVHW
jgi:hypothetical protein